MRSSSLWMSALAFVTALVCPISRAAAGPYPSFTDTAHQVQPSQVKAWASQVVDYSPAPGVGEDFDDAAAAVGSSDGLGVSLGDLDASQIASGVQPGSITVRFSTPIVDKAGPDLAVFENAGQFFTAPYVFGELAYVEVSSNGTDFVRFPSVSLNIEPDDDMTLEQDELDVPFGRNFAGLDTTNVLNLAGVHPTGIGTPFDLADLTTTAEVASGILNLESIRYVRLVDIPGNGDFVDSMGNPILDTWLTTGSSGLDLDAVGAINTPEPAGICIGVLGALTALASNARRRTAV